MRVDLANVGVTSWVLGFGPFDFLPITRQAPFTELAIRTKAKPEGQLFHQITDDRSAAHLADMIHKSINPAGRDIMWELTKRTRLAILGGQDDVAAKAKITYALPAPVWMMRNEVEIDTTVIQDLDVAG